MGDSMPVSTAGYPQAATKSGAHRRMYCNAARGCMATQSRMPIACVSHPNAKVAHASVSESAESMKPWLDCVLERYRNVQNEKK